MSIKNTNKLYPLLHLWQALDAKNCWASSRYEYAYIWILYFWLPVLKWWWFIPYIGFKKYSMKLTAHIFASYPCPTHTSKHFWFFWFSERIPSA